MVCSVNRALLVSSIIRVVAVTVVVMALSALSFTYANEGTQNKVPIYDPPIRHSEAGKYQDKGFLGWPWGTRPSDFEGARHIADIAPNLSVFGVDLDLSPLLGTVSTYSTPRLVFAKDVGLVKAYIALSPKEYEMVHEHLIQLLGEPAPIIYELWAARVDFISRSEWLVGRNTRVVLTSRRSDASIEIDRRDVSVPEGRSFEDTLAADQLQQVQEYERQSRILEASSVYQELLNGTASYRFFIPTAQERLAGYSGRKETVEFLGQDRGFAFSRLKNLFSGIHGQQWVRIDLSPEAREALQKQRPSDIEPQDKLSNISAGLCRVKVIPTAGKYLVLEQVWLDSSNRIIGGRPAWAPQDAVWPVPYIRQACEGFLQAWFTVESTAVRAKKEYKE